MGVKVLSAPGRTKGRCVSRAVAKSSHTLRWLSPSKLIFDMVTFSIRKYFYDRFEMGILLFLVESFSSKSPHSSGKTGRTGRTGEAC